MEGSCLCGAIKVKVDTVGNSHLCHCLNCRKVAGGIFGPNMIVDTSKVSISGEDHLKMYSDGATSSGTPVERYFCSTCGVPIRSLTPKFEGKTILKLGIYPKLPKPECETFVRNRQDWEKPLVEGPQYKGPVGGDTE